MLLLPNSKFSANNSSILAVIIPVVSRVDEIQSAVESSLNAIHSIHGEVIISLNGNDSQCFTVINSLRHNALRKCYWPDKLDIGDHWNGIIRKAVRSSYFTIVPDDDRITDPVFYAKSVSLLDDHPGVSVLYSDPRLHSLSFDDMEYSTVDENHILIKGDEFLRILRSDLKYVRDICPVQYTTLIRTASINDVVCYPNCLSPDLMLAAQLACQSDVLVNLSVVGKYKRQLNSLSLSPPPLMIKQEFSVINNLKLRFSLDKRVVQRLIIRTERVALVALLKSILNVQPYRFFELLMVLCPSRAAPTFIGFMNRLLFAKWPKLSPSFLRKCR